MKKVNGAPGGRSRGGRSIVGIGIASKGTDVGSKYGVIAGTPLPKGAIDMSMPAGREQMLEVKRCTQSALKRGAPMRTCVCLDYSQPI